MASPNPASSSLTVAPDTKAPASQGKTGKASFTKIGIIDKHGNFKKRLSFAKGTSTATIDVSFLPTDTYVIRVFNGTDWEEYKIIVVK